MVRLLAIAVVMGALSTQMPQSPVPAFDLSLVATQKLLAGSCLNPKIERVTAPLTVPSKMVQTQLACDGYLFAGKPRHAEFTFVYDRVLVF
jgi:hypothetical protein